MLFLVIQMTVNSKKNIEQKEYLIFLEDDVCTLLWWVKGVLLLVKILSQRSAPFGDNIEQKEYLIFLEDDVLELLSG